MKDITFETHIIAANPHGDQTNSFIKSVMQKIAAPKKQNFLQALVNLQKPAIALAAFVIVVLLGGAVYAAVHFTPALIQLLGKETNSRGATEYSVAGFADCAKNTGGLATQKFEIKAEAPHLTDDDVQKILQAKCELSWVNKFVDSTWPKYGTNPEWKDGDTIYYARTDILGNVVHSDKSGYSVRFGQNQTSERAAVAGETLKAYAGDQEISLDTIRPNDTVFTIVKVSEIYHDLSKYGWDKEKNSITMPITEPDNHMTVIGALAVFKLSLADKYYGSMQDYITEVPECVGNAGEYCPNTPSIDVYPRVGGEGATNPNSKVYEDGVVRMISGTVTTLSADTVTLKSRTGNIYTATVGEAGFEVYNRDYTAPYAPVDAKLKIGSTVMIMYNQPKNANPKTITKEQISRVGLQLESLNPKRDNIKQY